MGVNVKEAVDCFAGIFFLYQQQNHQYLFVFKNGHSTQAANQYLFGRFSELNFLRSSYPYH